MLTWTQVLAVGLLLSLCLHAWQLKLLADERQRSNCWRSKAEANEFYLSPQDFPTVVVPESDCVRIFTQQGDNQP